MTKQSSARGGSTGSSNKRRSVAEERAEAQRLAAERRVQRRAELDAAFADGLDGTSKIRASWLVTIVCAVLGLVALAQPEPFGTLYFVVTVLAFVIGTGLCAWAFVIAAQRSRTHRVDVGSLVFGTGIAPPPVIRSLWTSTIAQMIIGIGIAIAAAQGAGGVATGTPEAGLNFYFGSMLAMFGCGMQLWWCAAHGKFAPLDTTTDGEDRAS